MEEKVFFDGEFGKICGVLHTLENDFEKAEIVILVHGHSSNKNGGPKIHSKELNKIGINALRIDLDNQGESELDFRIGCCITNYVKQVEAAIKFVKEKGFKEISLLGTSFGGLVVLATTLKHPEIKRIFLRASSLDFQKEFVVDFGKEKFIEFEKMGFASYDNKTYFSFNCYKDAKDYSMFEHAHKIKQSIMIVLGDKDEYIDYNVAKKIVKLFPNAQLHIITGATHNLGVDGDFSEGKRVMMDFFSN